MLLICIGPVQQKFDSEHRTESLRKVNIQASGQESHTESTDIDITYEDLEGVEYQPPRQADCCKTTVYFQLQPNNYEGIPVSCALGNQRNALLNANNPAPWGDDGVSAKLSLRLHVSISA